LVGLEIGRRDRINRMGEARNGCVPNSSILFVLFILSKNRLFGLRMQPRGSTDPPDTTARRRGIHLRSKSKDGTPPFAGAANFVSQVSTLLVFLADLGESLLISSLTAKIDDEPFAYLMNLDHWEDG
jgi:hypothetical protein